MKVQRQYSKDGSALVSLVHKIHIMQLECP